MAASRGRGTTPAGGEDAPGQVGPTHPEESFSAALGRRSPHGASDDTGGGTHDNDAAGPRTGELQEEDAADAGASKGETPSADGVAAAIANAIVDATGIRPRAYPMRPWKVKEWLDTGERSHVIRNGDAGA